jgi:NDP-sugar pyrophosphorylase family protein
MEEKPDFILEIVAGIYYMRPALYRHVPEDTYFGIDDLVGLMLERGEPIGRYLLSEYWLDLGQIDDYSQAEAAYRDHFESAPSRSAG